MRILVIEDYIPLLNNITDRLKENGYIVDSTESGDEGLWYAENHDYDVILLDIMLPKISGLEILARLRQQAIDTPVIIISARDSIDNRIEGLDAGASDYLVKPFSLDEMEARVRCQIRNNYKQASSSFHHGNITIDFTAKRVFIQGEELQLTRREYGLLEYLAYRAGEVVSREEIWRHVYHEYDAFTSNAVDVYVGYLRKKLKQYGVEQLILTRRGQGYLIEKP